MSTKHIVTIALMLFALLSSCIPSNKTIGEQFVSGDYILKVDTALFNLDITNKMPDSIQAISSYMIVGYLADPFWGITSSASAVRILPTSNTTDFGDNPELKSISLRLVVTKSANTNYSEEYDGIAQNIYIYKLKKTIDSTRVFNTSYRTDAYDPTPIHIGSPVYYGGDSIGITLSNVFGEELLATTPEEFQEEGFKLFTERIKGLYITTQTPEGILEGGRLNFLPINNSFIRLNYLLTDPEREFDKKDTTEIFTVGRYFALNQIESGSQDLASTVLTEKLYIDGLAGIKPYINGVFLKKQLDDWLEAKGYTNNSIIVSRASITLPFAMPSDDYTIVNKRYPKFIYPCRINSYNYFEPLEGLDYTGIENINRSLMTYPITITKYVQDLIQKDPTEVEDGSDDLWFSPILANSTTTRDAYGNPSTTVSKDFDFQTYCNGTINGSRAQRKPTLSLVFTVIAE